MSRGVAQIERALEGQPTQRTEPPVIDDWSLAPDPVQRFAEKARRYFANNGAIGIEDRSTATETHWVIWCFHVRDGERIFTVINDKSRRSRA